MESLKSFEYFERLPKLLRRKIALELYGPDLINLCLADKEQMKDLCDSDEFWRQKLLIDYPESFLYFAKYNLPLVNPKKTYIRKFTELSRKIEKYVEIHEGILVNDLYNKIYKTFQDLLKLKKKYYNFYIQPDTKEVYLKHLGTVESFDRLEEFQVFINKLLKEEYKARKEAEEVAKLMK